MGIPSWAIRGQKVVCKRDGWERPGEGIVTGPIVGSVYEISEVVPDIDGVWLGFVEFMDDDPPLFPAESFSPVVAGMSEAEDVAMFRDLIRQPEHV